MKQIKNILINTICIVSLFGLMSCIKEIDLESLRPDPTLVVNCVAITGEPLTEVSPVLGFSRMIIRT